jgi:tetratricopeptide (TPR) repeat protein
MKTLNNTCSNQENTRSKVVEDFKGKLFSSIKKQILEHNDEKTSQEQPFLFLVHGIAGIGKHSLLKEIEEKLKELEEKLRKDEKPVFVWLSFDHIDTPKNPLDLMEYISIKIRKSINLEQSDDVFTPELENYDKLLRALRQEPIEGNEAVTKEQFESVKILSEWGGRLLGAYVSLGVPPLIPFTSGLGGEAGKVAPVLLEKVLTIKDTLLNKHKATHTHGGEQFQDLLLSPIDVLTPKFIEFIIKASENLPIIIIFEKYEKIENENYQTLKLKEWFSKIFMSAKSKLIEEGEKHRVRFIISSRKKLIEQENWNQLEEYYGNKFHECHLGCFNEKETSDFLEEKIGKTYKNISDDERKSYFKLSQGHPKYLELICKTRKGGGNPDFSQINQEIAKDFLSDLDDSHRIAIQQISCCQWLDEKLIEDIFKDVFTDSFNWYQWLKQFHFILLDNDKYRFDSLVRQVFRRSLFQENREKFYHSHAQLAKYFKNQASTVCGNKPTFLKYDDPEWCEQIGNFLYYSCFAQSDEFQSQFLYHLFASSYLHNQNVIRHSWELIEKESLIDDHPLLQSSTRAFLKTLKFIYTYSWVSFELDASTDYSKYQSQIESAIALCKSHLSSLDAGIGKVAVLEFILKNLRSDDSESDRLDLERELSNEVRKTASSLDANFSSQLFMQTACWQAKSNESIIDWCNQAIQYKPDNVNAWHKKGLALESEAEFLLDEKLPFNSLTKKSIEKLYDALKCYEHALHIQSYDHRFWESRGNVLKKIADKYNEYPYDSNLNPYDSNLNSNQHKGFIFQKVAYYQLAIDSYKHALQFRPEKPNIIQAEDYILKQIKSILEGHFSNALMEEIVPSSNKKSKNTSSNNHEVDEYYQLIDKGDDKRLNGKNPKDAFNDYCKAIYQKPEHPLGWYSRGLASANMGKNERFQKHFENAIKDYTKALELKSDLDWAFHNRGIAYYEIAESQRESSGYLEAKSEYEKALKDFDNAIKVNLEYEIAWYYRGLTLFKLELYPQAIASYDKCIQIHDSRGKFTNKDDHPVNKERVVAFYDRGLAYEVLRYREEAIASFQRAIKEEEKHIDSWYHYGICLNDSGKFSDAVEQFKKAIELIEAENEESKRDQGKLASVYYDLGNSYARQLKRDNAISAYKEALRLNPKYKDPAERLVDLFIYRFTSILNDGNSAFKEGKYQVALQCFCEITSTEIDDLPATEKLKELLYQAICGILRSMFADASLVQSKPDCRRVVCSILSKDKELRERLRKEGDYSKFSRLCTQIERWPECLAQG